MNIKHGLLYVMMMATSIGCASERSSTATGTRNMAADMFIVTESGAREAISSRFGYAVAIPPSWHVSSKEEMVQSANDSNSGAAVHSIKAGAILEITKFKEPYQGLNPNIQIFSSGSAGIKDRPPVEVLQELVMKNFGRLDSFAWLKQPESAVFGSFPAATSVVQISFPVKRGAVIDAVIETWLVMRNDVDIYYLISASTRPDEQNGTRDELGAIVRSIELLKPDVQR